MEVKIVKEVVRNTLGMLVNNFRVIFRGETIGEFATERYANIFKEAVILKGIVERTGAEIGEQTKD